MPIKVLSIGSDRKLFEEGSAVSERIKGYGALVEELHIVVFTLKFLGLKDKQFAPNIWVYPTNSFSRWLYIRDASSLGKKIVLASKFVRGQSLVTTQDPFECGVVGYQVKKKWRLPLEVQLHTDPFSPYFSGLLNALRRYMANYVMRHADSLRVVSRALSDKVVATTGVDADKIFVLPIYVDRKRIEDAPVSFDMHARYPWHFILLAVSRLAPEKNISLALRVLALVRNRFPDTGLVIVGSGPEENKLRALVKKLNLEGAVAFVGWQNDLASFYKTSNVFIQTSLFEGYGLALVEAGLSGLPIITTPVGIARELEHGKDAYIYPADNAELFANGIVDLIENNHKRESMKLNAKQTLETMLLSKDEFLEKLKYNWEKATLTAS